MSFGRQIIIPFTHGESTTVSSLRLLIMSYPLLQIGLYVFFMFLSDFEIVPTEVFIIFLKFLLLFYRDNVY